MACSVSQGFHHASFDSSFGYCTFNGLVIAARKALVSGVSKVLIIDGDAHYGDGTDSCIEALGLGKRVINITRDHGIGDAQKGLDFEGWCRFTEALIHQHKPGLVIYQAGADAWIDDPYGCGYLSFDELGGRDLGIFNACLRHRIPAVWNLAGGYTEPIGYDRQHSPPDASHERPSDDAGGAIGKLCSVTKPMKAGLVILGMVLIGLFAYVETTQVEVTVHQIGPAGDSSEAITVIQVSDLHIRSMGRRELAVVGHLNALKSDLLVLSGDVIDDAINLPVLERFLASLEPGNKVAVLGNWEHWSGVDLSDLRALYDRYGVRLLVNEQVSYHVGKRRLVVAGLDDYTAGAPDPVVVKGLARHGEVSLVVQHSPSWFEATADLNQSHPASLCLAGHTHGGQIAPFGMVIWTPRGSGHFIAGRYELGSCPLYISRGIGTSIAPLRIGARPEIALFKL